MCSGAERPRCVLERNRGVTHDELREAIRVERQRFDDAVAGLDRQTLETVPMCGSWSARDLAGHLLDWQTVLLASARFALGGPRPIGVPIEDGEAFNTSHSAARVRDRWSETKADLDASLDDLTDWLNRLTPEQLATPADFPWGEPGGTVGALLAVIPEHLDEHCAYIEAWRQAAVA
jgi:hypothetical protein